MESDTIAERTINPILEFKVLSLYIIVYSLLGTEFRFYRC